MDDAGYFGELSSIYHLKHGYYFNVVLFGNPIHHVYLSNKSCFYNTKLFDPRYLSTAVNLRIAFGNFELSKILDFLFLDNAKLAW